MESITGRTNDKIRRASALMTSAERRREQGLFVLEGARLCADAAESGVSIIYAFITPDAAEKYGPQVRVLTARATECYTVTPEIAARLSDTRTPQGVFCVCKTLDKAPDANTIDFNGRYAALDHVQDPSNFGAVCRTAEALGLSGVIAGGGCDIYNPKALRAAMGSSLRLPVIETADLPRLLTDATENGMLTLAATAANDARDIREIAVTGGVICVIGNEGRGVTPAVLDACAARVTIPMKGRAESLNAAASAAILMWELTKGNN